MKKNFWEQLAAKKKPFFVLAPMADVTDIAQRQMLVKHGKPDVLYTEFVSADGLANEKGREVLIKDFNFKKNEHPIVAQIFGATPENIKKAAMLVRELGFDGLDINMGCPDKAVIKQGAGSALIKNPKLAREIIRAAKEGAGEMPVSVKTRIGFSKNEIETWIPEILAEKPASLIVHLRTKKEMSEVGAHWELAKQISKMAKKAGVILIGNGDVRSLEDGKKKAKESGVDGIMIGRGIFGNPWLFNEKKKIEDVSLEEKLKVMIEHAKLFEKYLVGIHPHTYDDIKDKKVGNRKDKLNNFKFDKVKDLSVGVKGFHIMRKHFKAYISGFDGAKELRAKFMETNNVKEVEEVAKEFFKKSLQ